MRCELEYAPCHVTHCSPVHGPSLLIVLARVSQGQVRPERGDILLSVETRLRSLLLSFGRQGTQGRHTGEEEG